MGQSQMDNPEKLPTRRKIKQKQSIICVEHRYTQSSTNNVNKTRVLLQTTGGKDEPNVGIHCVEEKNHHLLSLCSNNQGIHLVLSDLDASQYKFAEH